MHHEKEVWLPPPQYYELHRFRNYTSIDEIARLTKARNGANVPMILPVDFQLKGSIMLVYPGDDLYPSNPSLYESTHDDKLYSDKTYEEVKAGCRNFSRIEMSSMFACNFMCNVDDGLLSAASGCDVKGKL